MHISTDTTNEELAEPMTIGAKAYTDGEFARAERDRLWRKTWQHACRVEEIPNIGNYTTYDILDDSILIVRTSADKIVAHHNVCQHRGRRLVDAPNGAQHACGKAKQFVCGFHGWRWNLDGENIYVLDKDDWEGALTDERIHLKSVSVDTWGGWVWINMDLNCEPLSVYLQPFAEMLEPFEFQEMRYRWRQWLYFDCNWKTALEAFIESYHVQGTHPQLLKYADFYTWSKAVGLHGIQGFDTRAKEHDAAVSNTLMRPGVGDDPRVSAAALQREIMETVNGSTTQTLVDAAARLVDELPAGTASAQVMAHFLDSARRDDATRGVIWPTVDPEHYAKTGLGWHVFPNMSILHGYTFALFYRSRPNGYDPNKCIFEVAVMERYPPGKEPKTEWIQAEPTVENWRSVLVQDFANMSAVQKGMKSLGFSGALPNPKQERAITNFHRNLAEYMGAGAPLPLT